DEAKAQNGERSQHYAKIGWSKNQEAAKTNPKLVAMNKKFGMIYGGNVNDPSKANQDGYQRTLKKGDVVLFL
ncbi:hypothetical protein Goklo_017517, partial [Gossypium klotzschianum]|nr:hypothetical protein [Gossypium klotzschianum]